MKLARVIPRSGLIIFFYVCKLRKWQKRYSERYKNFDLFFEGQSHQLSLKNIKFDSTSSSLGAIFF